MSTTLAWKARPIFISSTFKDMQKERDYLRSHVFPRLEEELNKRRHRFAPIDLRLGVETAQLGTEEAREGFVLKVCLEEIQRSRPFLLVLLGDRYGWVPPPERMAVAAQEAGFKADLQDKSVTALEIEFGLLKQYPDQRRRCFFYFRQPLPYAEMPPAIATRYSDAHAPDPAVRSGHARLQALKQILRSDPELSPHVHEYTASWDAATGEVTGLEAWGELVFRHLWGALEEETRAFAALPPPSQESEERAALEEFAEIRSRDFTGRKNLLQKLQTLATGAATRSSAWGACLTGVPGSGKSAVFAELFQWLSSRQPEKPSARVPLILANAAGGTPLGSQVGFMLRRFIQEMADFLKEPNPLPEKAGPEEVDATFASLLTRAAAHTRVVVLLDALDQFEPTPRGQHLTWLRAKRWPANARLLATSAPCPAADTMSRWDGVRKLDIPPLGPDDIREIAKRVWARYHRQVNPDVVRILTETKRPDGTLAADNPLWLILAQEQLNLLDSDDFARAEREFAGSPSERIRALLLDTARRLPPTVADLYDWLLDQTERAYGMPQARAFAALIALSRFGWRESDLLKLIPRAAGLLFPDAASQPEANFDDLRLAVLRRGFRAHLGRRGAAGQLDFNHAQMRQAVRKRALGDSETVKKLHLALADNLERLPPDDPLRVSEFMVHLIEADDAPRAARIYAELPKASAGFAGATQALANHIVVGGGQQPNPNLGWVVGLLTQPGIAEQQVAILAKAFNFDLNAALENTSKLATRQCLFMATRQALQQLASSDPSNTSWQRDLSMSHDKVGDAFLGQGDLSGALHAYEETHAILQRLAFSVPSNADWQRDLSVSHNKIGDVLRRRGDLGSALKMYRESRKIRERLISSNPSNVSWQRDLYSSFSFIGMVLQELGDLVGALEAYSKSQVGLQGLVSIDGTNSGLLRDLSVIYNKIGDVLRARWDLNGAVNAYHESVSLVERLVSSDPSNVGWRQDMSICNTRIGDVLLWQGDPRGALNAYRKSMVLDEGLVLFDPFNAVWQRDLSVSQIKIGDVLLRQGNLRGALHAYRKSLVIRDQLVMSDPTNAGWQRDLYSAHGFVGTALQKLGDLTGALAAFREYHAGIKRLALLDPYNADWQRDLSVSHNKVGDVLLKQDDLDGALIMYQDSLVLAQRMALIDPSNTGWKRDLATSQERIGDALLAKGELERALNAYRESLGTSERLALSDPSNASGQRDLFTSYWRMADLTDKIGAKDSAQWWKKAYDQLDGMKQSGVMLPTDEKYFPMLKQKAGL